MIIHKCDICGRINDPNGVHVTGELRARFGSAFPVRFTELLKKRGLPSFDLHLLVCVKCGDKMVGAMVRKTEKMLDRAGKIKGK